MAASEVPYKIVVLNHADQLSGAAQSALRRTMEKYSSTCRMILVAESASKVLPAVRSLCLEVRVPLESEETVSSTLCAVAAKGGLVRAATADASDRHPLRRELPQSDVGVGDPEGRGE